MEGILPLQTGDHIIGDLVHHMDGTAVYIQDDVVSMILVLMYHDMPRFLLYTWIKQRLRPLP